MKPTTQSRNQDITQRKDDGRSGMRSVQIDFENYQTTTDINSLMRCIEKCCRLPFVLGFIPLTMHDTLMRSVIITLPSVARDITNRNLLARFDAAIIGWSWGRGMPNIKIEYSMG